METEIKFYQFFVIQSSCMQHGNDQQFAKIDDRISYSTVLVTNVARATGVQYLDHTVLSLLNSVQCISTVEREFHLRSV